MTERFRGRSLPIMPDEVTAQTETNQIINQRRIHIEEIADQGLRQCLRRRIDRIGDDYADRWFLRRGGDGDLAAERDAINADPLAIHQRMTLIVALAFKEFDCG